MEEKILNFSDLTERKPLDGVKIGINEILDKPIVVTGFKVKNSKYQNKGSGFCTTIQFYFKDDENKTKHVVFSGSGIIKDQMEEMALKFEELGLDLIFNTTVKRVGNYYSLT